MAALCALRLTPIEITYVIAYVVRITNHNTRCRGRRKAEQTNNLQQYVALIATTHVRHMELVGYIPAPRNRPETPLLSPYRSRTSEVRSDPYNFRAKPKKTFLTPHYLKLGALESGTPLLYSSQLFSFYFGKHQQVCSYIFIYTSRQGAQLDINLSRKWRGLALENHQRSGVHLITENDNKLFCCHCCSRCCCLLCCELLGYQDPGLQIYTDGTWTYEGYRLEVAV